VWPFLFESSIVANLFPIPSPVDAKEKLIRTKCIGKVTLDEVLAHFRELERDSNSPSRLDVFLDLTETTSLPAGFQIAAVADQIKKIRATVRFNACGIVAARDALYGMLRMFSVMAEPYFRAIRVFRVSADAETWLAAERLAIHIPAAINPMSDPEGPSGGSDPRQ